MKRFFYFSLLLPTLLSAQVGYVDVEHIVYPFLERMDRLNLIEDYDPFEIPKSRREVSEHLKILIPKMNKLIQQDKEKLQELVNEFEFDIYYTTKKYTSLLSSGSFVNHFSQNEKFLYFYTDSTKANVFVNFLAEGKNLYRTDQINNNSASTSLFKFGGKIRGSFLDHFGFSIEATNGTFLGDKYLARTYESLRYNYKLSRVQDGIGDDYYDETEGFFAVDYDFVKFKIGRDRVFLGSGITKTILSDNAPPMDYINLSFRYKAFSFSHYHGKLLGSDSLYIDPVQDGIKTLVDKYYVYHRFSLDISRHFSIGLGEMTIYANRNMDLSYLNPFNFYKSIEHINQDRDNSLLFLDVSNTSIEGVRFYSTLLLDDIDFGKIGTKWWGNKTLFEFGVESSLLYNFFPLDLEFQFIRIDPYVFTHRINENNYTSLGFPLVKNLRPNSNNFAIKLDYFPLNRLDLSLKLRFTVHGANEYDSDGTLVHNHGGEIAVGHRVEDSESAGHLDGVKEYARFFNFSLRYEPIKNYVLKAELIYINNSLANNLSEEYVQSIISLGVRL